MLSLSVADVPDHEISQKRYHSSGSFVEINRETEVRADRNNFLHFGGIDELIVASLFKRGWIFIPRHSRWVPNELKELGVISWLDVQTVRNVIKNSGTDVRNTSDESLIAIFTVMV